MLLLLFVCWFGLLFGGGGGDADDASPPTPPDACTPPIAAAVIAAHTASPSMLAVFALQDLLALSPAAAARPAEEETVNDPTVRKHYWR